MEKSGHAILMFFHKEPVFHLWTRFLEDHSCQFPRHSVQPQLRLSLLCPSCLLLPHTSTLWDWHVQITGEESWKLDRGAVLQGNIPPAEAECSHLPLVCPPVVNQGSGPLISKMTAVLLNKSSIANILLLFLSFEKKGKAGSGGLLIC